MWKDCNVVMLPTNKKQESQGLCININKLFHYEHDDHWGNSQIHLYITSDEEIKEGDWFLTDIRDHISDNNGIPIYEIEQCIAIANGWIFTKETGIGFNPNWCKKIIATTDTSLKTIIPRHNDFDSEYSLPSIPQQFIQQYIEEYNKGNVINRVKVEHEIVWEYVDEQDAYGYNSIHLKINPDNTINIKPIKDSWSRFEYLCDLEKLAKEVYSFPEKFGTGICFDQNKFNKWIEENL